MQQVFPKLDDLKKKTLKLDGPIVLPVLRNVVALQAEDELCLCVPKKDKAEGEPLREAPSKRLRKR